MSEKGLAQSDVGALFHSVLFAYQKALRDVLGEVSSSIITGRTVPIIEKIIGKASPGLVQAEDMDEALKKFADLLMASELAGRADVKKEGEKYILDIYGCVFAGHVHDMLDPKDVTCPWGIIAMSIAQKTNKQKVKMALSKFSPEGSRTPIELEP